MLARLQRLVVVTLVSMALGWALWFLRRGLPGLAIGGALLILLCHAPVLAVEFLLQPWLNRDDPAPPAGAALRLRAWCREVVVGVRVFGWRQPFRAQAVADYLPLRDRDPGLAPPAAACGVLLVHGYLCNRGMWAPWLARLRADGVACLAPTLEPVFGRIESQAAALEAAALRLHAATGAPLVVVAHSMGGLAVRAWLAGGSAVPVAAVVTIASPHRGTWLARFGLAANTAQMRLGSEWLAALVRQEGQGAESRYVCFHSHCDNVVMPASTATLPGADNRHLRGCAHLEMAYHPAVFSEVWRLLAACRPVAAATAAAASGEGRATGAASRR